jgi:aminoglycoside phosphotransferase (APT) family kinase protein
VPRELAETLRQLEADPDPLRRAGAELVLLCELGDLATTGGEILLHGDFYLGNVLVDGDHVSALIDFEFARMGPPDLELISVVRALDAETRLGVARPPLLAWLAEDYPELFGAADLDRRLWLYALAYTIRHIIFWPPDRGEADGLEATHPLHTLRRLVDAPLPLPLGYET